jgi:hypothetical protein
MHIEHEQPTRLAPRAIIEDTPPSCRSETDASYMLANRPATVANSPLTAATSLVTQRRSSLNLPTSPHNHNVKLLSRVDGRMVPSTNVGSYMVLIQLADIEDDGTKVDATKVSICESRQPPPAQSTPRHGGSENVDPTLMISDRPSMHNKNSTCTRTTPSMSIRPDESSAARKTSSMGHSEGARA